MNPLTNYAEVFNKNDSNMYFHSMPMSAKPVSLNGNVLDYIICYPGIEIPCRGELLEEKDGKIARYHVCYRAE